MNANMKIAAAIRRVLDRHGDVLEAYPEFVREHLLARLDVGASSEVSEYAERLSSSTLARGGLVTSAGRFQRDEACLKVLVGHKAGVTHVAALPDGRALSASNDNTLRLWDLALGECLRVLEGPLRPGDACRGAARRARALRVFRQDLRALGHCLRSAPARP